MLRRGQGGLSETLARTDVHEPALGGALPPDILRAVERAVLRAIGVPVPLEPL